MGIWLSEREQRLVAGAETASAATPIPTQIVSNGEYLPPRQSATQKRVEARINQLADANAARLGLNRRQFFRTGCGMAAADKTSHSRASGGGWHGRGFAGGRRQAECSFTTASSAHHCPSGSFKGL